MKRMTRTDCVDYSQVVLTNALLFDIIMHNDINIVMHIIMELKMYFTPSNENLIARSEALLKFAKDQLKIVLPEEDFIVADLFVGVEWKRLPKHERHLLGKNFYEFAKSNSGKKLIELNGVNSQRQQLYKRKQ